MIKSSSSSLSVFFVFCFLFFKKEQALLLHILRGIGQDQTDIGQTSASHILTFIQITWKFLYNTFSNSAGLEWGLRFCISNRLSSDAAAVTGGCEPLPTEPHFIYYLFIHLALLRGLRDLSSPARD